MTKSLVHGILGAAIWFAAFSNAAAQEKAGPPKPATDAQVIFRRFESTKETTHRLVADFNVLREVEDDAPLGRLALFGAANVIVSRLAAEWKEAEVFYGEIKPERAEYVRTLDLTIAEMKKELLNEFRRNAKVLKPLLDDPAVARGDIEAIRKALAQSPDAARNVASVNATLTSMFKALDGCEQQKADFEEAQRIWEEFIQDAKAARERIERDREENRDVMRRDVRWAIRGERLGQLPRLGAPPPVPRAMGMELPPPPTLGGAAGARITRTPSDVKEPKVDFDKTAREVVELMKLLGRLEVSIEQPSKPAEKKE
jgi:hypothetical protein